MKIDINTNIAKNLFLQDLSKELGGHTKTIVSDTISSISYAINYIYKELNPEIIASNHKLLRNSGIYQVGKTLQDGIQFAGDDYNYLVRILPKNGISLKFVNKSNQETMSGFTLTDGKLLYSQAVTKNSYEAEDIFTTLLEDVENKVLRLKSDAMPAVPRPYIPTKSVSEKIAELNSTLKYITPSVAIKDFAYIRNEDLDIAEVIIDKFQNICKLYREIPNDASRFNVRKYYTKYINSTSGDRSMTFDGIGPVGERMSVKYSQHRKRNYLLISVENLMDKNKSINFVINENGSVQRNLPYRYTVTGTVKKRVNAIPDYYTQAELDNSNFSKYLVYMAQELEKFETHTQGWLDKQADLKEKFSKTNEGSLSYIMPLINKIFDKMQKYKSDVQTKLPRAVNINDFRRVNHISNELSTTAVKFVGITKDGNDLRISFPKVFGKPATQILVMNDNKVKDSFYIIDEKLLKFTIKSVTDKFTHANRQMYFHSDEYIKNSNLEAYLNLLDEAFTNVNKNIDALSATRRKSPTRKS